MTTALPNLNMLAPFESEFLALKNRIVLAPMTRSRANDDGTANALMLEYYRQRASAGLVVTEAVAISPEGTGYVSIPGLYNQAQRTSWQPIVDAVHSAGSKLFVQLLHGGRIGHSSFNGGIPPIAPSPIKAGGFTYVQGGTAVFEQPREATVEDIQRIIQDNVASAKLALEAGADGVELHGANGYLPNQFLAEATNHRTDAYGGSPEGRSRFVLELTEALVAACGPGKVGVRLSPLNKNNGAVHTDSEGTYGYLIPKLNSFPLAYLHLMEGFSATELEGAHPHPVAARYRRLYAGTLIASTGLTRDSAEQLLSEGTADLVAFGSAFLANPDLPERFRHNLPLNTPDRSTFYTGAERGYTDYPSFSEKP